MSRWSAHDADSVEALRGRAHGAAERPAGAGTDPARRLRFLAAHSDLLGVNRMSTTLPVAARIDTPDLFASAAVRRGALRCDGPGATDVRLPPGTAAALPERPVTVRAGAGAFDVLYLPRAVLRRVGWEHFGAAPETLRFDELRLVDREPAERWARVIADVGAELIRSRSLLEDVLLEATFLERAALVALDLFPNNATCVDYRRAPGWTPPGVVRRAVDFIEAHADRPVSRSDIAGAAGVSPEELGRAFRTTYDISPEAYLRRVRLEYAHGALLAGDPGSGMTVARVARHFGFAQPSRFVSAYRRVFGVHPLRTLNS